METKNIKEMMLKVCEAEIAKKEELCRLDSFVGDGDHGFTVERGFSAVQKELQKNSYSSPCEIFETVGDILADSMGGAIGMIIGALFTGGAMELGTASQLNASDFVRFFQAGLDEIKLAGGAKEGDRTLVDALSPAVRQFRLAEQEGKPLFECFQAAAQAAMVGAESTKNMMAKKGRAKFLREKSIGYIDAGSMTMAIIITAMADYIKDEEAAS